MEGSDFVAGLVSTLGTILAGIQLYCHGDGTTITAMIGLYGTILGYYFGKRSRE